MHFDPEPMETDSLLVEFMDPSAPQCRTVPRRDDGDGNVAQLPLENNGRVEGRQQRMHRAISDDDEMLDIVMDGRDAQGMELPDKSQGELTIVEN